jgi:hypothetical protein
VAEVPRVRVDRERLDRFCKCMREALNAKAGVGVEADDVGDTVAIENACGPVQTPPPGPPLIQPKEVVGNCEFILTGDEKSDVELREWLHGRAKASPDYRVADYLKRESPRRLRPSLEAELDRLRTILAVEAPGQPGGILITYGLVGGAERQVSVEGFSDDPYKGYTWALRLSPGTAVENQTEIADYIRRNEDAVVDAVKRLVPRRRRGYHEDFWRTHPGLHEQAWVNPPLPYDIEIHNYPIPGHYEPEQHPEDG